MARRLIACLSAAFILILCCQVLAQGPPPGAPDGPNMPPMPPGASGPPPPPTNMGNPNGSGQKTPPFMPGGRTFENMPQNPRPPRNIQPTKPTAKTTDNAPPVKLVNAVMPTESSNQIPVGAGRNWPVFRGDESHTGFTEENLSFPLKLMWKFLTDMSTNNPSSPSVVDGVVYFCSASRVYAVNAETGSLKWRYPAEEYLTSAVKSSPAVGQDLVYFGAGDGKLYAVTKESGDLAWTFSTKGIMNSSPILVDGVIYVGSSDDRLYALDAVTGQEKWLGGFRTKDDVACSPAYLDGLVYFLSNDMVLYAAHTSTGRIKWQIRVGNWSAASTPVISDNNVYLATGNSVQVFQAKSGKLKWSIKLTSDVSTIPAVGNGMVFFACRDGMFYGVTSSGKLKWKAELGSAAYGSPVIAGNTVLVGANRGALTAFNVDTGAVTWKYFVKPSYSEYGKLRYVNLASSPAVSNGVLYILADDGALHAFRPDAPDTTAPTIEPYTPIRDGLLPGSPPMDFAALVYDEGSGLQDTAMTMKLDDQPVEYKFLSERQLIYYRMESGQSARPLADGQHSVTVTAYDWAGNKGETTWYFTINNRIKRAPKATAPAPGAAPGSGAPPRAAGG